MAGEHREDAGAVPTPQRSPAVQDVVAGPLIEVPLVEVGIDG